MHDLSIDLGRAAIVLGLFLAVATFHNWRRSLPGAAFRRLAERLDTVDICRSLATLYPTAPALLVELDRVEREILDRASRLGVVHELVRYRQLPLELTSEWWPDRRTALAARRRQLEAAAPRPWEVPGGDRA